MWLKFVVLGFALVVLPGVCFGQYRSVPPTGDPSEYFRGESGIGLKSLRGLLDPSRMHMSHSISFGYANAGGRGVTQGLYLNRLDYQIARPLFMTTYLGYRFQPSGPAEWNPANNGTQFVGGAELNWRPRSDTSFRLSIYRGMYPQSSYYGDYHGWDPYEYRARFDRP